MNTLTKEERILLKITEGPTYTESNTIINSFKDYEEIVIYKHSFLLRKGEDALYCDAETGEIVKKIIDRRPLLKENEDGVLVPNKDNLRVSQILQSGKKSCNRAMDKFYGYALSNIWNYFLTFTIDSKYDKGDDKFVKKLYSKFVNKFTKRFKDVKILCRPERTEIGQLHFHCFVGNCDLSKFLVRAINPHTLEQVKSKCGHLVYNLDLWNFGFSQVCIMPKENNLLRVTNYMSKYLSKQDNIGRHQKRFYHTSNLNFKDKAITYLNDNQIAEITNSLFVVKAKETSKLIVLRRYKEEFKKD